MKTNQNIHLQMNRQGFVMWLVAVLAFFIFLSMLWITNLTHGEISQLARFERLVRADLAARACYQEFAALLRVTPWEKRPTLSGSYTRPSREFNGSTVTLLAEDVKGSPNTVDVWVHSACGGVARSFVNRVEVHPSLMQKMNELKQVHFTLLDPGIVQGEVKIQNQVDKVLAVRESKQAELNDAVANLRMKPALEDSFAELNMDATDVITQLPKENASTSLNGSGPTNVSANGSVQSTSSAATFSLLNFVTQASAGRVAIDKPTLKRTVSNKIVVADIDSKTLETLHKSVKIDPVSTPPLENIAPVPTQSLAMINQAAYEYIIKNRELLDFIMKNYPEAVEMVKKYPERVAAYLENRNINLMDYIAVYEARRSGAAATNSIINSSGNGNNGGNQGSSHHGGSQGSHHGGSQSPQGGSIGNQGNQGNKGAHQGRGLGQRHHHGNKR